MPKDDVLKQEFVKHKGTKNEEESNFSNWIHFPKVSEVETCYIFYDTLINLWDKYWISLKNKEREALISLSNSEAQGDGITYHLSQLNFETLKLSNILKYPNLLRKPQMLLRKIIEGNPSFLCP